MYGANGLCYFSFDRLCTPWPLIGATAAFEFFDYTGLGDFAAKAWPLEFVGVLRDRDEFLASLSRGETCNAEGYGSLYEQSIYQTTEALALGFGIPVNVISAKRLDAELRAPYKLVAVPNNATLSDANAALLRGFVEAGGHLILEGATIRNATMARLAGVRPDGDMRTGALRLSGTKPPLQDWSATLTCAWQPIEVEHGVEILAVLDDDQPAITMADTGKGKVVYIAPRFGPYAKSAPLSAALRRIAHHPIGYVPVLTGHPGAWPTVLTDGSRYVICIYNDSDRPGEDVTLTLSGFPPDLDKLVSLRTGSEYSIVGGKAHGVFLPLRKPDYFMMSRSLVKPKAHVQDAAPIGQSLRPGMTFLNLPPLPKK
jgi:hypothetical protein